MSGGRIYVDMVTIGSNSLYNVIADPSGVLSANASDMAFGAGGIWICQGGTSWASVGGTASTRTMPLSMETFKRQGVNAPPEGSITGNGIVVGGLQFDTTARLLTFQTRIPTNAVPSLPITLDVVCALLSAETAGDTLEFTAHYVVVSNSDGTGNGGLLTKTSTVLTTSVPVLAGTGQGLSVGATYHVPFVLDCNDPTNPIDTSDDQVLALQINRTTVGGAGKVGNVLVTSAHLQYTGY